MTIHHLRASAQFASFPLETQHIEKLDNTHEMLLSVLEMGSEELITGFAPSQGVELLTLIEMLNDYAELVNVATARLMIVGQHFAAEVLQ